jgi:hypothetical protein
LATHNWADSAGIEATSCSWLLKRNLMESADCEPTSEIVLVCGTFLPINFSPAPPSGCRGCFTTFRSAEFRGLCTSRDGGGSVARLNGTGFDAICFGLKLIDHFVYFCHGRPGASLQTARGPLTPERTWYCPQELRGSRLDRRTDPALVGQRHGLCRLGLKAQSSHKNIGGRRSLERQPVKRLFWTTMASLGHTFIQATARDHTKRADSRPASSRLRVSMMENFQSQSIKALRAMNSLTASIALKNILIERSKTASHVFVYLTTGIRHESYNNRTSNCIRSPGYVRKHVRNCGRRYELGRFLHSPLKRRHRQRTKSYRNQASEFIREYSCSDHA